MKKILAIVAGIVMASGISLSSLRAEQQEHAGDAAKEHAGDAAKEHAGEAAKEQKGEAAKEHAGEAAKEHAGEAAKGSETAKAVEQKTEQKAQ